MADDLSGVSGVLFRKDFMPKKDNPFYLGLMSDWHLGSDYTDYGRLKEELDILKEKNARIHVNSDVFDCIFPRDFRFMPSVPVPEIRGDDYMADATIDYASNFLEPYADNIDVLSMGNHEYSLASHGASTNMIARLINRYPHIRQGEYQGYLTYRFKYPKGGGVKDLTTFWSHGKSGNTPVTKGVIDYSRWSADIEGFDILTSGHNHEKFALPHDCFRKDGVGNPARRNQKWVKTGSYLSYKKGNYGARSGMSLKPKGGYLIKFWFSGSDNCHKNISTREIIPR
jgi:hypothetical protein